VPNRRANAFPPAFAIGLSFTATTAKPRACVLASPLSFGAKALTPRIIGNAVEVRDVPVATQIEDIEIVQLDCWGGQEQHGSL